MKNFFCFTSEEKILIKVLCEKTTYIANWFVDIYVVVNKIIVDLNTYVFSYVFVFKYITQNEAKIKKIFTFHFV